MPYDQHGVAASQQNTGFRPKTTRTGAEELKLKVGDTVKVVVKSTEVMIQKD
jgi:hypothetical protein